MGGKGGSRGKGRSHPRTFLFSQSCFYMPRQQLEMPRMFKLGLVEWSNAQAHQKVCNIRGKDGQTSTPGPENTALALIQTIHVIKAII